MTSQRIASVFAFVGAVLLVSALTPGETRPAAARTTLTKVREIRQLDLVEPDSNFFSMDEPGLELTYDVTMPEGRQLLEINQPEPAKVSAVDSAGTDLSRIEPGFMDKLEFVKMIEVYGEGPKGFTFHLALPSRQAERFNLDAQLEMVTYASNEEIVVEVSSEWTELDAALFGKKKVQARLEKNGNGLQLVVQPGTVKSSIENVQLFDGGTELEESFSMWNDMQINYSFSGEMAETLTAKFTVHTGLTREMLTIALDDQPLP